VFDNEWHFKNVIVDDCVDVKSALKKMREKFFPTSKVIVEHIYSEES
jgi:hypothetical protein